MGETGGGIMVEKSVSFRTHLQSNALDLLSAANINCAVTAKLVSALVSKLAAYTEEGVPLAPAVFVCNSIVGLVRMSGAGEYVPLSDALAAEDAASKILKVAAPLCGGTWRIYVERIDNGANCKFGVFCGSSDPSSLSVDEVTLSELDAEFPIVRISQSVTNKVEVRTSAGDAIEFRFNDEIDMQALDSKAHVSALAAAAVCGINPPSASFAGFMERTLEAAIRNSHGTLVAVVAHPQTTVPAMLTDAVILGEPVDLYTRHKLHEEEEKTAVSVSRLQTASELLRGFINSDGITVLDTAGKILAYRAFVKSADPEAPSDGGARTRAYHALAALVGTNLQAAFFRSQDGRMQSAVANGNIDNG